MLFFGPIRDRTFDFHDAGAPRFEDRIQAIDDLYPAGLVCTALPYVRLLGHDATKELVAPAADVRQAFGEL